MELENHRDYLMLQYQNSLFYKEHCLPYHLMELYFYNLLQTHNHTKLFYLNPVICNCFFIGNAIQPDGLISRI